MALHVTRDGTHRAGPGLAVELLLLEPADQRGQLLLRQQSHHGDTQLPHTVTGHNLSI